MYVVHCTLSIIKKEPLQGSFLSFILYLEEQEFQIRAFVRAEEDRMIGRLRALFDKAQAHMRIT